MADLINLQPGETDLFRIVSAIRQLQERYPSTEDSAAGAVPTSRQIISGAGLTGGGDLSADRTLNVGAGNSITVNVNDVAMSDMAQATIKGRASGAGTGAPQDLTATQAALIVTAYKVASFTRDLTTASGSQAVTGVGFKPKAIMFLAGKDSAVITTSSGGFSDGSGEFSRVDITGTGDGIISPNSIVVGSSGADFQSAVIASFDTDGFTLTWAKTGTPTGTAKMAYLAFR